MKRKKKEEDDEKAGLPTRNRPHSCGLYGLCSYDAPELCFLSLREAPAYRTVVNLHYFQSIILWVCRENQGTRCNKAQPSC